MRHRPSKNSLQQRLRVVAAVASPLLLLLALVPSWGDVFPGQNTGAIPDSGGPGCGSVTGASRNVTFDVDGLTGPVGDIDVALNLTHSWVGDVDAQLISPNGDRRVLFARTGVTTDTGCGDSSNLSGNYVFDDSTTPTRPNWWTEAANQGGSGILSQGEYRTTASGGAGQTSPAPTTLLFTAFSGLPPLLANGTWTLQVRDWGGGDTGSVIAASLGINEDCLDLGFTSWVVTSQEDWAACDDISIAGSSVVRGPGGDLTVTSGGSVIISDEFEVEANAAFTAGNSDDLVPLLVALRESRIMGEAERAAAAAGAENGASLESVPNEDKLRELRQDR